MSARVAVAAAAAALWAWGAGACDPSVIELRTEDGRVVAFSVEIADTPESRSRGLMGRTDLARDAGMLFIYEQPAEAVFWMKDTPLELDMLFFGPQGRLCGLVERATPFTVDPRPGGCVSKAVLEVHGGTADAMGLGPGTVARHPAFGADAALACGAG